MIDALIEPDRSPWMNRLIHHKTISQKRGLLTRDGQAAFRLYSKNLKTSGLHWLDVQAEINRRIHAGELTP